MTVKYFGIDREKGQSFREATIFYDEKREEKKADFIYSYLIDSGWEGYAEDGALYFKICDKEQYDKEFLPCYKKAKMELKSKINSESIKK